MLANTAIFLFLVTFNINLYIAIPDIITVKNSKIFREFTYVKLNILKSNGKYAVNGL